MSLSAFEQIRIALQEKRVTEIAGFSVVTDRVEYQKPDQVFPLHPENQFFIDEIAQEKMRGASALEIGLGSGALSIAAVRVGARHVTALEINPRAKAFAGFNLLLNGVEDKVDIREGDTEEILKPVQGMRFDYILSNPPFEPTPPGAAYYLHSAGGMYGLDFTEKLLKGAPACLSENGHLQIVTFAPGNEHSPFKLIELIENSLPGAEVRVNPISLAFDGFLDRFVMLGAATEEQLQGMKHRAREDGVSRLYLCMVHYDKGQEGILVVPSPKIYENWDLPLGSKVPMGVRIKP